MQTRFILAGSLLAMITVGSGFWSVWTFARLGRVVDQTLRDSQATIDLAAALAESLEREDDALLLALSGDAKRADRALLVERRRGDDGYAKLRSRLAKRGDDGASAFLRLQRAMGDYRASGSILQAEAGRPDALKRYHGQVNPLLRRAVRACAAIRERNFSSMRLSGVRARDEARAATRVVFAASLAALLLATVVAVWLAQSVVRPIRALTSSVDAIRLGDFDHRLAPTSEDELGRLAAGFNRMAETLAEYRRSSLGELLAAKTTLESTLEALPDAVFVIAPDGSFAALNPAAHAILRAKRVADARRVHDLPLAPVHREAVEAALAGRAVLPSRADFAHVIQARLDGEPRKFLVTAVPIPEFAPRRTGAVVVLDDVTEFALLDELRSELVAVASHELKTPLTTLRMNVMLLGESAETFTPRQRSMLDAAVLGCEELGNTIDELLDVTRIESGQLRLDLGPVDLNQIVDTSLRVIQARFDDAEVRLIIRRDVRPALVLGDPSRLRTVLTNILSNALKYSPQGGTVIIQIASPQNAGGDGPAILQLAVTDAGPGVPEAFRERVFGKFFRIEHHLDRASNSVRGTGIGLYLCREIVKAHGGSIWCEPAEGGHGTTFALKLPTDG
ncbi:sensor histidine kinase [Singulisphaera sp. GP187]|uniref:sensor histidine kinase n=1 Tax=Singulisphaera sp. GP187 TaxID=1882752 RepID=UPI0013563B18|nr:ATP-binding protein [Singulisphaera sp. GP187]